MSERTLDGGGVIEAQLPARLGPLKEQALAMFEQIESEKARCYVQQTANGHDDDDVCLVEPDGRRVSYAERRAFLESSERNLRQHLPRSVIDAIDAELSQA